MNTPNNKRRKESQERIESAFVKLLQTHESNNISVTDICKEAAVNRTTFYANYIDIYDLVAAVQKRMRDVVFGPYQEEQEPGLHSDDFLKLFCHIQENPLFYKTYFKLGLDAKFQLAEYDIPYAAKYYDSQHIAYHLEFFRHGLNAIIKMWLDNGCRETPEEMTSIVVSEYMAKS